jgi:hypothetical protein
MKTPDTIYLQTCGDCCGQDCENCNFDTLDEVTWCKDKINDSDTAYFSEEAVRKLLRDEYASMNTLLRIATKKDDADVIEVEKSIETAIKKLKGGKK